MRGAALACALAALAGCRHAPASAESPSPPVASFDAASASTTALTAGAGLPPPAPGLPAFALFPVQNASGGPAPTHELTEALETELARRGLPIIPHQELDAALVRARIRYLGGVDRATAKALAEDLGIEQILIPTLEQYSTAYPPKSALSIRAVELGPHPTVRWADTVARAGDDSPGFLGLGLVTTSAELDRRVVAALAASVEAHFRRSAPGASCGAAGHLSPRRVYRAAFLDDLGRRTVAVLPFQNRSDRWDAAEVVRGQFVAQLARSGTFDVLDPGFVREQFLANRIVLEGGVSVDRAMALLDLLGANLVVSGVVEVYAAPLGAREPPRVELTAYVIDRDTTEIAWTSNVSADGDDWLHLFGLGRERTSSGLSCRVVRGMVDGIVGERLLGKERPWVESDPQRLRRRWSDAQFQRHQHAESSREDSEKSQASQARTMNLQPQDADLTKSSAESNR